MKIYRFFSFTLLHILKLLEMKEGVPYILRQFVWTVWISSWKGWEEKAISKGAEPRPSSGVVVSRPIKRNKVRTYLVSLTSINKQTCCYYYTGEVNVRKKHNVGPCTIPGRKHLIFLLTSNSFLYFQIECVAERVSPILYKTFECWLPDRIHSVRKKL